MNITADVCIQTRIYSFTVTDDCGNVATQTETVGLTHEETSPVIVARAVEKQVKNNIGYFPARRPAGKRSNKMYIRDGIYGDKIEVLPVGCDTDSFIPHPKNDPKILAVRESLGISPDQLMILTVGGDAASKGAQEVMQEMAIIDANAPHWKHLCKVWPQPRTKAQNLLDLEKATHLGIEKNVVYTTNKIFRTFMPYGACDIYAAPSRLEGFGMPQVEAGA